MSCCQAICDRKKRQSFCNQVCKLIRRKSPTNDTENAWLRFEKIMMWRSNINTSILLLREMAFLPSVETLFAQLDEYAETEKSLNYELVAAVIPYI